MPNRVKITTYVNQVRNNIEDKVNLALEECVGEVEARTKRNTKVKTGRTRDSWEHHVDERNHIGYVGSSYENAMWEELGTGIYSEDFDGTKNDKGRQTAWAYKDENGEWHRTRGKKPRHMLFNALKSVEKRFIAYFKGAFKE